ncbi:MAG: MBL fold metallo-hydrolase [Planctomycetota bacterium]|nr:MBL fold metallo-hydrolase [Planctomycetota bacterium]MDA1251356.1 MBL fold metallo-hydrolase [Planctomycetota bacterium]
MRTLLIAMLLAGVSEFGSTGFAAVSIHRDAVNGVVLGGDVAVYGAPPDLEKGVKHVLLTHHRRDVLRDARKLAAAGVKVVAPRDEEALIARPGEFWQEFSTKRFHDYAQQSTKILGEPLKVDRWVEDGDEFELGGKTFRVISTPGFTRGAVSYITMDGNRKTAFTGDLIYGDGQILDLYSFQDAIPEAKVGGYHGYGGRLAQLISSLRKIRDEKPDVIIPARGPLIPRPAQSIDKLISRVQALYANYLSTNALNWYFKEERMTICGRRVLGEDADIKLMPYSLHQETPDWIWEQATSRMIISDDGHGILLDCGYQRVIDGVKKLMAQGLVKKVDGIFVTHYHDDHTDMVQAAAEEFGCPIYSTLEYEDILENPAAYHMPAMTANPMKDVIGKKSGSKMKWKEFDLTFEFFPGQALYHGALLVKRGKDTPVFFIGDAFSPSGIDDYCVLNRNLAHKDQGYQFCLERVAKLGENHWLINEHIPHVFRFSPKEMDYLQTNYKKRVEMLRELSPWDDPNYAIDEHWAVFYPYGLKAKPGETVEVEVRVTNHSPQARAFKVTPNAGAGFGPMSSGVWLTLEPDTTESVPLKVRVPQTPGTWIVTADIESKGMTFHDWAEALITVE